MKRKLDDPTHSSTKPTVNFAMADDLLSQPFVGSEDNDVGIVNDNTKSNPTLEKEGVDILSLDVSTNIKSPLQRRVVLEAIQLTDSRCRFLASRR